MAPRASSEKTYAFLSLLRVNLLVSITRPRNHKGAAIIRSQKVHGRIVSTRIPFSYISAIPQVIRIERGIGAARNMLLHSTRAAGSFWFVYRYFLRRRPS